MTHLQGIGGRWGSVVGAERGERVVPAQREAPSAAPATAEECTWLRSLAWRSGTTLSSKRRARPNPPLLSAFIALHARAME